MKEILKIDIESESRPIKHTVTYENNEWHCTCEDHKFRNRDCKHIKKVQKMTTNNIKDKKKDMHYDDRISEFIEEIRHLRDIPWYY